MPRRRFDQFDRQIPDQDQSIFAPKNISPSPELRAHIIAKYAASPATLDDSAMAPASWRCSCGIWNPHTQDSCSCHFGIAPWVSPRSVAPIPDDAPVRPSSSLRDGWSISHPYSTAHDYEILPLASFTPAEEASLIERSRVDLVGRFVVVNQDAISLATERIASHSDVSHTLDLGTGEVGRNDAPAADFLTALARRCRVAGPTPSASGSLLTLASSCDPVSNTGSQDAVTANGQALTENRALVDYLGCTFQGDRAMFDAEHHFGAGLTWEDCEKAGYFFRRAKKRGEVTIYYDHMKPDIAVRNPVFVLARGKGCRQLEAEGLISGLSSVENLGPDGELLGSAGQKVSPWQAFLADLLAAGATFPRLDVALDCFDGLLDLDAMMELVDAGLCSTRFNSILPRKPRSPKDGSFTGYTIEFGQRNSKTFVRAYDKGLELLAKGEAETVQDWKRVELEAHDERAYTLARKLVQYGLDHVVEVLWSYIDFKDPDSGYEEKSKKSTISWWADFLKAAQKMPLGTMPKMPDLKEKVLWLVRQCAPTLYAVRESPGGGRALLEAIVELGGPRLSASLVQVMKDAALKGPLHEDHRFGAILRPV